ncbi:MAG: GNAT family N-acetyltransferase [candidate division Zixibacteria bacterium]|nr:GNAT family N-acetyltransferase [candidate division Zixibacteria bacterium]
MNLTIHPVADNDKEWVLEIVRGWGADFIVSRGRKVYPTEIDGLYAVDDSDEKVGLVTYEIIGDQCEIVTLDAFRQFCGVGTALMDEVIKAARARGCSRLWLITLNDNLDAIRFYQRRGFTIAAIHLNAMEISRAIKPSIPRIGMHGIPIRDEIEFEMSLD